MKPLLTRAGCLFGLVGFVVALSAAAATEPSVDPRAASAGFAALKGLSGRWIGVGHGQWGDSASEKIISLGLGDSVICVSGRSVYPRQDANPKGEVHGELALFHLDRGNAALYMNEYTSEGFATRYRFDAAASEPPAKWVFVSESGANLPASFRQARLTLRAAAPDLLLEDFELDVDGKGFTPYVSLRHRRLGEATAADCQLH